MKKAQLARPKVNEKTSLASARYVAFFAKLSQDIVWEIGNAKAK